MAIELYLQQNTFVEKIIYQKNLEHFEVSNASLKNQTNLNHYNIQCFRMNYRKNKRNRCVRVLRSAKKTCSPLRGRGGCYHVIGNLGALPQTPRFFSGSKHSNAKKGRQLPSLTTRCRTSSPYCWRSLLSVASSSSGDGTKLDNFFDLYKLFLTFASGNKFLEVVSTLATLTPVG